VNRVGQSSGWSEQAGNEMYNTYPLFFICMGLIWVVGVSNYVRRSFSLWVLQILGQVLYPLSYPAIPLVHGCWGPLCLKQSSAEYDCPAAIYTRITRGRNYEILMELCSGVPLMPLVGNFFTPLHLFSGVYCESLVLMNNAMVKVDLLTSM